MDVPCPGATSNAGFRSSLRESPAEMCFTHSSAPAGTGFPCSPILRLSRRCSPSTGWRSSLKWSKQCSPPLTRSRSLWAWWNTPGSIPTHTAQSSRSPYTSPQFCKPCLLPLRLPGEEITGSTLPTQCCLEICPSAYWELPGTC